MRKPKKVKKTRRVDELLLPIMGTAMDQGSTTLLLTLKNALAAPNV
jgi:hypothetical protein